MTSVQDMPGQATDSAISTEQLRAFYVSMLRIRLFEERVAELVEQKQIHTPTHLYIGQEAIATGVCSSLRLEDYIFGNHRSHGHYLAKGGDMNAMMAEIFGKKTGCSRGRGGSMHLIAPEVGVAGTAPIVSGTVPIAVGAALAMRLRGEDRVSVAFFGDGALEEGTVHEALNLAAHRRLPVIFACENNLYASHLSILERRSEDNIPALAAGHGLPGVRVDGNDVLAVYRAATEAVQRARAGHGPTLLECRTYRWRGHVGPNYDLDKGLRSREEFETWTAKCPLRKMEEALLVQGVVSLLEIAQMYEDIQREVDEAFLFAKESPYPAESELLTDVFQTP